MQTLENKLLNIKQQLKTFFNKKSVMLAMQLAVITAVVFCSFENGIINEIRNILEILNIRNVSNINKFITEVFVSLKTIAESVQLFNILCIVINLFVSFVLIPLCVVFFVKTSMRIVREAKQRKYDLSTNLSAEYKAVYIVQSKFVC